MTLKSLGIASLGLLKRGLKKTLHIASLGLLRLDTDEKPVLPRGSGTGFVKPGRMVLNKFNTQSNNAVIVMLESSLL